MKKKIRIWTICMIMLGCIMMGGLVTSTEVQAKQQIKASKEMKDAPQIKLDKLYHIAANDCAGVGKADIAAWYVNSWNYFEFVSFKLPTDMKFTFYMEETGGSNCWVQIYDINGQKVGAQYNIGTRSGEKKREVKYSLKKGTYYLGLQPHSTADIQLKTEKKIVLSEKKVVLEAGDSTIIEAVLKKADKIVENAEFTYKSSKKTVAKVSSKGKIVAVAPGNCKITVKSNGVINTVSVIVLPGKVKSVKQTEKTRTSIKLSWKKQTGVSGYEVWMYDTDLGEFAKEKNVSSYFSSAYIKNLKSGTTYKFRVRSYVKVGSKKYYGEYSKVCKMKTKGK